MNIKLSQQELKVIVGILTQVQLRYQDSLIVNKVIEKLDSFIEKPKSEDIIKKPMEGEVK